MRSHQSSLILLGGRWFACVCIVFLIAAAVRIGTCDFGAFDATAGSQIGQCAGREAVTSRVALFQSIEKST
jgi:hypothetical protein